MKRNDDGIAAEDGAQGIINSEDDTGFGIDISLITAKHASVHSGETCVLCGRRCAPEDLQPLCTCSEDMLVHKACLEARLRVLSTDRCQECGRRYEVSWQPRHGVHKALWSWTVHHASKIQLALIALLAVVVAAEGLAFRDFVVHSMRVAPAPPGPGNGTVAEYWQRFVSEMSLPSWFLSLSISLFCRQLLLLISLVADAVLSFLRWRCSQADVTILRG